MSPQTAWLVRAVLVVFVVVAVSDDALARAGRPGAGRGPRRGRGATFQAGSGAPGIQGAHARRTAGGPGIKRGRPATPAVRRGLADDTAGAGVRKISGTWDGDGVRKIDANTAGTGVRRLSGTWDGDGVRKIDANTAGVGVHKLGDDTVGAGSQGIHDDTLLNVRPR